jgi:hypothetical protein
MQKDPVWLSSACRPADHEAAILHRDGQIRLGEARHRKGDAVARSEVCSML